jgi:hypothetical protein
MEKVLNLQTLSKPTQKKIRLAVGVFYGIENITIKDLIKLAINDGVDIGKRKETQIKRAYQHFGEIENMRIEEENKAKPKKVKEKKIISIQLKFKCAKKEMPKFSMLIKLTQFNKEDNITYNASQNPINEIERINKKLKKSYEKYISDMTNLTNAKINFNSKIESLDILIKRLIGSSGIGAIYIESYTFTMTDIKKPIPFMENVILDAGAMELDGIIENNKWCKNRKMCVVDWLMYKYKNTKGHIKSVKDDETIEYLATHKDNELFLKAIDDERQQQINSTNALVQGSLEANLQSLGVQSNARKKAAEDEKELDDTKLKYEQAKRDSYAMTADTIGVLGEVIGQQTAAGKLLSSAQALINTFLGITQVWANKTVIPEPFGTAQKVAATATAAASGFLAVRNINKVQVPKGGGGVSVPSLSAPITPSNANLLTTSLSQQTINAIGNSAIRAYVVETDITSNQKRVTAIKQRARFG